MNRLANLALSVGETLVAVQRKPGWVDGSGREPIDDVSAEELGRMEEVS